VVAEELVPWDGAVNRRVVADWLIGGEGGVETAALAVTEGRRGDGPKETVHPRAGLSHHELYSL